MNYQTLYGYPSVELDIEKWGMSPAFPLIYFPDSTSSSPMVVSRTISHAPAHRGERERETYFSVVTGTHYRAKTPPDQQPTKLCAGV